MLDDVKVLLGISLSDTSQDERLNLIISTTTARLKLLLGGIDPPESMQHIVTEAAIIRFNRIGSEGLSSHSVEGESYSFTDNDFAAYADEIQAFLDSQDYGSRGKVRFI